MKIDDLVQGFIAVLTSLLFCFFIYGCYTFMKALQHDFKSYQLERQKVCTLLLDDCLRDHKLEVCKIKLKEIHRCKYDK